jgi:hypothetical protein
VVCPESCCTEEFNHEGIRQTLETGDDKALFEKYDHRLTLRFLKQMPEFIMCANPGCDSGQFHDPGPSLLRKMTCMECKRNTCSFHEVIWHIDLTCDQYDRQRRNDIPSENWIRKNTKQCPQCHRNIQKNRGCDHMTCKMCEHRFYWS